MYEIKRNINKSLFESGNKYIIFRRTKVIGENIEYNLWKRYETYDNFYDAVLAYDEIKDDINIERID